MSAIASPFQVAILVLAREASGPYYLPMVAPAAASAIIDRVRTAFAGEDANDVDAARRAYVRTILKRWPYERRAWTYVHRVHALPGSCSFSIAMALQ